MFERFGVCIMADSLSVGELSESVGQLSDDIHVNLQTGEEAGQARRAFCLAMVLLYAYGLESKQLF